MQSKIFSFLVILLLILNITEGYSGANLSDPDIQVIKNDQNSLVFEWQPKDIKVESNLIDGQDYKNISFLYGETFSGIGAANIPWRVLTLGIPEEGIQSVQIVNIKSEAYSSVKVTPVPQPYKDS